MNKEFLVPGSEILLTAAAMRESDRRMIEDNGVSGFTLMERAGRGAVAAVIRRYGEVGGKRIAILCGRGNNGGDGFVMGRLFYELGARVSVFVTHTSDQLTGDAALSFRDLEKVASSETSGRLTILSADDFTATFPSDLIIEALLGTGASGELREPLPRLVREINASEVPVVSVDIPTGLNADTGVTGWPHVQADFTITFAARKIGQVVGTGPVACGITEVVDIGIPARVMTSVAGEHAVWRVTREAIRKLLPVRPYDAHKYSVGMALVVGGSPGLTGAPVLAATAAARVGAGAVVCACDERIQDILALKMTEIMTLGLPSSEHGIDPIDAVTALEPRMRQARALLVGPGLGRSNGTRAFVHNLLDRNTLPVVIDADGLNALNASYFHGSKDRPWILTPHAGEFERLLGSKHKTISTIEQARCYAVEWNCVLVLKGAPTLVGLPDGTVYANSTGNPVLATAGTGDVLAGLIVGLLAQGLSPAHAALAGVYIGGLAANRYVRQHGPYGMLAGDLHDLIPSTLREIAE